MAVQASFKAVAVGAIFFAWANIRIEAFKLSWHIISTSPEKETSIPEKQTFMPVIKAVCEKCRELYEDDEYHLTFVRGLPLN